MGELLRVLPGEITGVSLRKSSGNWLQTIGFGGGKSGNSIPQIKRFLTEVKQGITPQTIWPYDQVGHTQDAKKEILILFGNDVFLTPKPERLMQRIIHIATNPGDFILDSFLGSGTTAAVAHKMGRRYIGIEMGDHAITHCAPRLQKVIEGEQGGISESVGWKGGGGFRFYRLGPPTFDADASDPTLDFPYSPRICGFLKPGCRGMATATRHCSASTTAGPARFSTTEF